MYRLKKYDCGKITECEITQLTPREKKIKRAKKVKETCPEQKNLNNANAKKYIVRKVHLNFGENDYATDFTFEDGYIPKNKKEAHRLLKNYFARIRYILKKKGKNILKYLYIISNMDDCGNKVRLHVHMFMSGIDRDLAESLWPYGRCSIDKLQYDEYGITGKSLYMIKQARDTETNDLLQKHTKSWGCSRNLINPEPIVSDKKITRKIFEEMLRYPEDRTLFEKVFPGLTFTDCKANLDGRHGTSLTIRLRRYTEKEIIELKKKEKRKDYMSDFWIKKKETGFQTIMNLQPARQIE